MTYLWWYDINVNVFILEKNPACPFTYQVIAHPFTCIFWIHREAFDLNGYLTKMSPVCADMNQA